MFRGLEDLIGASVAATGGEIGRICNFLFDDQSWLVRYLVVDVGHWLARRKVVISVVAIDQPDWKTKTVRAHLTKEQVRNGPNVDSMKPVSRQQEIAMSEYFGWPAYWDNIVNEVFPASLIPAGREFPVRTEEDPHLRSVEDVIDYEIWANNHVMGKLQNLVVDDASWHIGYLDVKTGDWLHCRSMLVPTRWVMSVSWPNHRVNLVPAAASGPALATSG
jgi:PRC-barrel domain